MHIIKKTKKGTCSLFSLLSTLSSVFLLYTLYAMVRDAIKAEERKRGDGENYGGERRSGGEEAFSLFYLFMQNERWKVEEEKGRKAESPRKREDR